MTPNLPAFSSFGLTDASSTISCQPWNESHNLDLTHCWDLFMNMPRPPFKRRTLHAKSCIYCEVYCNSSLEFLLIITFLENPQGGHVLFIDNTLMEEIRIGAYFSAAVYT